MEQILEKSIDRKAETVIGPSVIIQGDLESDGDVRIAGQVNGKVNSNQSVFIEQNARLAADIVAKELAIAGEVQGKLNASGLLVLHGTAKVSGEIASPVLRVEDGAQFSGKCAMKNK